MSLRILILAALLSSVLSRLALAQPVVGVSEITVTGEVGTALIVDDKLVGRLPLAGPLQLPAGAHRFTIERQSRRYESDTLILPAGRVAELSLTRGTKGTAIAVLSLTPMVMLVLRGDVLDDTLRQSMTRAGIEGARAEHTVLLPPERVSAASAGQAADCLTKLPCQLAVAQQIEARMLLLVDAPAVPPKSGSAAGCVLRGELFDVATAQLAAQAELPCALGEELIAEATLRLARRLIGTAANLGRGRIQVATSLSDARVTIDGQLRGVTPWQGPSLPGRHEVLVEKTGFEPLRATVLVSAGQVATVPAELLAIEKPAPPPPPPPPPRPVVVKVPEPPSPLPRRAPRPRWRLITGGALIGAGAIIAGFGVSAFVQDGACGDMPRMYEVCANTYQTTGVGGGLLGTGLVLAAAGSIMIAIPGERRVSGAPR